MMTPHKITFYAYAQNEEEAKQLQDALNTFVRVQYSRGILVTADKLINALTNFGNNVLITNFFRR